MSSTVMLDQSRKTPSERISPGSHSAFGPVGADVLVVAACASSVPCRTTATRTDRPTTKAMTTAITPPATRISTRCVRACPRAGRGGSAQWRSRFER